MSKSVEVERVKAIIAEHGAITRDRVERGLPANLVESFEEAYGCDMQKWPPEAFRAWMAMQMATFPDGPPLHETPRHMIVPTLRKAYRMVVERTA